MSPGPVTPPVTVVNTPPVVESIVASATRAEVETDVTLTATVRDAETPVAQLKYEWKADAGTFTGEGASVKWRAPKGATTPADYAVRLTVTETYGAASQQNVVNATSPVIRLHDSTEGARRPGPAIPRRLRQLLGLAVDVRAGVQRQLRGKADEKADIECNREHFTIVNSSLRLQNVRVASSGMTGDMSGRLQLHVAHHQVRAGDDGCACRQRSEPSRATARSPASTNSSGGGSAPAIS